MESSVKIHRLISGGTYYPNACRLHPFVDFWNPGTRIYYIPIYSYSYFEGQPHVVAYYTDGLLWYILYRIKGFMHYM